MRERTDTVVQTTMSVHTPLLIQKWTARTADAIDSTAADVISSSAFLGLRNRLIFLIHGL